MRYVREHERDVFWMTPVLDDDFRFRTALAAVMLNGTENDREVITKSLLPLKMLSAAASGIPVDFSQMEVENLLPLMKLWHDSAAQPLPAPPDPQPAQAGRGGK